MFFILWFKMKQIAVGKNRNILQAQNRQLWSVCAIRRRLLAGDEELSCAAVSAASCFAFVARAVVTSSKIQGQFLIVKL